MYVDILFPLTKAISVMFERVSTHYQTLQTWIGHNATRYHNLNALLHALLYIISQFSVFWWLIATGYHAFPSNLQKCVLICF